MHHGAQRYLSCFSGSKLQRIALLAALSERTAHQHLRHVFFQHNRPTALIAARMFHCLLLLMRRSRSIYLLTIQSGVFMITSSIEDSVVSNASSIIWTYVPRNNHWHYDWQSERHQHARSTCSRPAFRVG